MLFILSMSGFSLSVFFITLHLIRPTQKGSIEYRQVMCFFPAFTPICPLIRSIGVGLHPFMSWKHRDRLAKRLSCSGYDHVPAEIFCATQLLCGLLGSLSICMLFMYVDVEMGFSWVLACSAGWLLCSMVPTRHLLQQSRAHRSEIVQQWPYFIDLLVICLCAGMGFDAALRMTVESLPEGAVKKEWRRYLHDIHTGKHKHQALNTMIQRLELAPVSNFVSSLIYSEKYGSGLIRQMQQQSSQLRMEQSIAAEEIALKAPVKMLLPLSLCFFPCTFLVISYPIIKQLISATSP